jgi:flagellar capping protein FliD
MNISDFVRANAANGYLASNSTATTGQAAKASGQGLQKAEQRIQAMADTTSAQLSSFGKLKSAVSDAQTGARALVGFSTTTKPADVKTALTGFVNAFNAALTAAKTTTGVSGDAAASQSANRVNRDLQRSTSADTINLGTLKKIGVTAGADGKLAIDATKLGAALTANPTEVRDTLAKLGRQVEQAATKELATDGDVGKPLSALNQRSAVLKSQQATLASLSSQTAASTQPKPNSALFGYGVSAYQNGFV